MSDAPAGLPGASQPADGGREDWDGRYAQLDQVWSGQPNEALVAEVAELPVGRALDVGCGEGADAVWLALRGWRVTALDVSQVALDRAAAAAGAAGVDVHWLLSGLVEADTVAGGYDLVSAQYPALARSSDDAAEHALLRAVAPGGVLLVVHHGRVDAEHARGHGFDPDDYVSPGGVAALLGQDWRVEALEERPRAARGGAGAHHAHDVVLRATRTR